MRYTHSTDEPIQDGEKDKAGFQVNEVKAWAEDLAKAAGVKLRETDA